LADIGWEKLEKETRAGKKSPAYSQNPPADVGWENVGLEAEKKNNLFEVEVDA